MRCRFIALVSISLILLSSMTSSLVAESKYTLVFGIISCTLTSLRNQKYNLTVQYIVDNSEYYNTLTGIFSFGIIDQIDVHAKPQKDLRYAIDDFVISGHMAFRNEFSLILSPLFSRGRVIASLWIDQIMKTVEDSVVINASSFLLEDTSSELYRTEFTVNWRYDYRQLRYNFTYNYVFINPYRLNRTIDIERGFLSPDFSDFGGVQSFIMKLDPGGTIQAYLQNSMIENPAMRISMPPISTVSLTLSVEPKSWPITAREAVFGFRISSLLRIRTPFVLRYQLPSTFVVDEENLGMWAASNSASNIIFSRNIWGESDVPPMAFYPEKPRSMELRETVEISGVFPQPDDLSITIDETLVATPIFEASFPVIVVWPLPPKSVVDSVSDGEHVYNKVEQTTAATDMLGGEYKVTDFPNTTLVEIKAKPRQSSGKLYYRTIIKFKTLPNLRYVGIVQPKDGKLTFTKEDASLGYFRMFSREIENARFEFVLPKEAETNVNECTPSGARSTEIDGRRVVYWLIDHHTSLQDQYILPLYLIPISNVVAVSQMILPFHIVLGMVLIWTLKDATRRRKYALKTEGIVTILSLSAALFGIVIGAGSGGTLHSMIERSWKVQLAFLPFAILLAVLGIHALIILRKEVLGPRKAEPNRTRRNKKIRRASEKIKG